MRCKYSGNGVTAILAAMCDTSEGDVSAGLGECASPATVCEYAFDGESTTCVYER